MISEIARKFENAMVAVVFAERRLHDDAKLFLNATDNKRQRKHKNKRISVATDQPRMHL